MIFFVKITKRILFFVLFFANVLTIQAQVWDTRETIFVEANKCGWQQKRKISTKDLTVKLWPVGKWKSNGETYYESGKRHFDSRSLFPDVNVMALIIKIRDGNNIFYWNFTESDTFEYTFKSDNGYIQFAVNDGDCSDNEGALKVNYWTIY